MQNREKIIAGVMVCTILVWFIVKLPKIREEKSGNGKNETATSNEIDVSLTESGVNIETVLQHALIKSESRPDATLKDPFKKVKPKIVIETREMGIDDLVLSGIIWEENNPVILINEQILKVGDSVAGYTIEEINEHEGILSKDGETYTLQLFEE